MNTYKVLEIMGNFESLINHEFIADSEQEANKMILEDIKANIDKYLYAVLEEKGE